MINFNLCKLEDTGNYIELNFNSDKPDSLFDKVLLYTNENLNCKKSGIDLSYLLERTSNKESFLIDLQDLGFPNSLDLFYIKVETNNKEVEIAVTGNVTDIMVENLDKISHIKNDCGKLSDNCSGDLVNETLYTNLVINELPVLLNLKKWDEAKSSYYSVKNILTLPCEVFFKEFTVYTAENEVRFTLENIISNKDPEIIIEKEEIEIDIETVPPRGENIFNK